MINQWLKLYLEGKTKSIFSKIKNKMRVYTLSILTQYRLECLTRTVTQEKETKVIQTGKEEFKLSLFADDVILFLKDIKDCTKELLHVANGFGKVAGCKINIKMQ
jgi:hypothetical protein